MNMIPTEKNSTLLALFNILGEFVSDSELSKSMFVGDYFDFFCEDKVLKIMDAMKRKRKIRLEKYVSFELPEEEHQTITVAPYQLHYIHKQWYIMGQTDEYGLMRIIP